MLEFTNSECGLGSLRVWAGVFRLVCSNGLMVAVHEARSKFVHRGNGNLEIPDLYTVLNISNEYVRRMEVAKTVYLTQEDKEEIISDLGRVLTNRTADMVVEIANLEYHGGDTLFNVVNAITRAAQFYSPAQRTNIEQYGSRLLAA